MPDFSVDSYAALLADLRAAGYRLAPVSEMRSPGDDRVAFIRHDIDLHLNGIEPLAEAEAQIGCRATYYVLLTQHYNPWFPANAAVLHRLVGLGHEIGLHYDLATYPEGVAAAQRHLEREADALEHLVGSPVRTISMHQPSGSLPDPFRQLPKYVHPHDPGTGDDLLYVSDSCRAWRDENLLACFSDAQPQRVLLLTHPELWLSADETDRFEYLEHVLLPNAERASREFVLETVRGVWKRHPAPAQHDARVAARNQAPRTSRTARIT